MQALFTNLASQDKQWRASRTVLDAKHRLWALTDDVVNKTWQGDRIGAASALREQRRLYARLRRQA